LPRRRDDETFRRRASLAKIPSPQVRKGARVAKHDKAHVEMDRRGKSDRRSKDERRKDNQPAPVERRLGERRVKVQRRRQIDPTTCERDYNNDEIEFMQALDAYKRTSGRMFPTCSEILEVIRNLGYVRVSPAAVPAAPAVQEQPLTPSETF
jgi:hypothetical protein